MTLKMTCACGKHISAPDAAAGKKGKCPGCGREIVLPASGGFEVTLPARVAAATAAPPVRAPAPAPATRAAAAGIGGSAPPPPRRIAAPPPELAGTKAAVAAGSPIRISLASRAGYFLSLPALGIHAVLAVIAALHWLRVIRIPQDLHVAGSFHLAVDPTSARIYVGLAALLPLLAVFLCIRGWISAAGTGGAVRAGAAAWAGLGYGLLALALAGGQEYLYYRFPLRLESGYVVWGQPTAPPGPAAPAAATLPGGDAGAGDKGGGVAPPGGADSGS